MRSGVTSSTVPFGPVRCLASEAAAAIGGRLVGPDVAFDGASFDSRTISRGQLFVPIVADRDGHDYIADALATGTAVYLTSRPAIDGTAIVVDDTARALVQIAAWARRRHRATVVGVTGSVGKTSTKDLIAGALRSTLCVAANERSFNNEQGLPVTILNAPDDADAMVLEMGMRGFGEIDALCQIARPSVGVVTAVGHSHTERVGGILGVARAKRELVEALPSNGTAVLNADDELVAGMADHTVASVLTFGRDRSADVRITSIEFDDLARPRFRVETPWGRAEGALAASGEHMVSNAAAALAVAGELGVPISDAAGALATVALSPMRMETKRLASGAVVVNDAYNANPTSMRAALHSLARIPAGRRVAILGVMAELDDAVSGHADIAALANELDIDLIAVGTDLYGMQPTDDPLGALGVIGAGDAVLVKASRVGGLERIADALLAGP